jgi:hypothetical protein
MKYFAVMECKGCHAPIPLSEYDGDLHYKLADDSFFVNHRDQVAGSRCDASGIYGLDDVSKLDLPYVSSLTPNLDFAVQIISR